MVDDDEDIRGALRDVLLDERCRVLEASDGQEALAILAEEHPDLVLLDLSMPHLTGGDALDELNRSGRLNELCIVVITGSPTKAPPEAVVIAKPFGLPALMRLLEVIEQPASVGSHRAAIARGIDGAPG